jgi:hypothetical protein
MTDRLTDSDPSIKRDAIFLDRITAMKANFHFNNQKLQHDNTSVVLYLSRTY